MRTIVRYGYEYGVCMYVIKVMFLTTTTIYTTTATIITTIINTVLVYLYSYSNYSYYRYRETKQKMQKIIDSIRMKNNREIIAKLIE